MATHAELRELLLKNGIRYRAYWDKQRTRELVEELGLLNNGEGGEEKKIDDTLKRRMNRCPIIPLVAKAVSFEDIDTGETITFDSLYKAGKFIDRSAQTVSNYDGKVWNGKYKVSVHENLGKSMLAKKIEKKMMNFFDEDETKEKCEEDKEKESEKEEDIRKWALGHITLGQWALDRLEKMKKQKEV